MSTNFGSCSIWVDEESSYDSETMILTIGKGELDGLNELLKFAGYKPIKEESEYDLDITIK